MSNYKYEFIKEQLEGTSEFRYLEVRSKWYLSREGCLKHLGVDPEEHLVQNA
jgi:hypothetical protein